MDVPTIGYQANPAYIASQNAAVHFVATAAVNAAVLVGNEAADAVRGVVRYIGASADEPPARRQRSQPADHPYKRANAGQINDRDKKRRRNIEQLFGTKAANMVYGKRRRPSAKRGYNRTRPARRRPAVRRSYRKTYSKKRSYAKKSTMTAARLLSTMLR